MTFFDRTNSWAQKSRVLLEYLHVQKFQSKIDDNHFVPHSMLLGCFENFWTRCTYVHAYK
jgi:hypothetical protein